jgi:NhaA family Na+:H+ antiporter
MSSTKTAQLTPPLGERDHRQGPIDAPVTFVEYGDYQCPHCRQAHSIARDIQTRLGNRLCYVFRHFPISTAHPDAQRAAEAAEAAAAQGKFWEMHDYLYEHQDALDDEHLVKYAAELGLDTNRFERELKEHVYADRVREDFVSGVRSGVNGTPSFYINGERYDGPWDVESLLAEIQKPLGVQVRNLFQRFTRLQASGGILLLISTVVALIWANSPWAHTYFELWETNLSITLGNFSLSEHLLEWVNGGLMVIFFFVVGLEIKRELTIGELSSPKRAAMPIMAALGGMLLPAAIYTALNAGTEGASGWAIPTATDIAFTLAILTLMGSRVPLSLKVFFTALAIADDLGAVLVIALFYSQDIHVAGLVAAGIILLALIGLNLAGVRRPLPYSLLGVGLWLAFLESGLHPTIAGVLLAFTIPGRTQARPQAFMAQCIAVLGAADATSNLNVASATEMRDISNRQQAAAHTLEAIAERIQTPAQRLEHSVTPWATYLVLPLFALANAGVSLSGNVAQAVTSPIGLGIIAGLVLGKPVGITLFSWLAIKIGVAEMPDRVTWLQLFSAVCLAGIGFTMSLFIANSAFSSATLLSFAKISILMASLLAGVIGAALLSLTTSERVGATKLSTATTNVKST